MANEKRLIDSMETVTKISKKVQPLLQNGCSAQELYDAVLEVIADAPTVDAVEVVHGHWIECEGTICAVCNKHFFTDGPWAVANYKANYCPNCGAKMDGDGK